MLRPVCIAGGGSICLLTHRGGSGQRALSSAGPALRQTTPVFTWRYCSHSLLAFFFPLSCSWATLRPTHGGYFSSWPPFAPECIVCFLAVKETLLWVPGVGLCFVFLFLQETKTRIIHEGTRFPELSSISRKRRVDISKPLKRVKKSNPMGSMPHDSMFTKLSVERLRVMGNGLGIAFGCSWGGGVTARVVDMLYMMTAEAYTSVKTPAPSAANKLFLKF